MTNETCGHVDDTDSVDPFDIILRAAMPQGFFPNELFDAKRALADAGYQIVPLEK